MYNTYLTNLLHFKAIATFSQILIIISKNKK